MFIKNIFLILGLSSLGFSLSPDCDKSIKKLFVDRELFLADFPQKDDDSLVSDFNSMFSEGTVRSTRYFRDYNFSKELKAQSVEYSVQSPQGELHWTYTLSNEEGIFQLLISSTLFDRKTPVANFNQYWEVSKTCKFKPTGSDLTRFDENGSKMRVSFFEMYKNGQTADVRKKYFNASNFHFVGENFGRNVENILWFSGANTLEGFSSFLLSKIRINISPEDLFNLSDSTKFIPKKSYQYSAKQGDHFSMAGRYQRLDQDKTIDTDHVSLRKSEELTKSTWLKTNISPSVTKEWIHSGFSEDTFKTHPVAAVFQTSKKIIYNNINAYFKVQQHQNSSSTYSFTYKIDDHVNDFPGNSNAIDDRIATKWGQFLKSSKYYEVHHPSVQELVKKIQSSNPRTRADAIKKILSETTKLVKYDEKMAQSNSIVMMPTSEILKRKKGVCQHFSNLFVTLSRALNIPARSVLGVAVDKDGIEYHSWVEVLWNDKDWVPLEPQEKKLQPLQNQMYIPFMVDFSYEAQSDEDDFGDVAEYGLQYGLRMNIRVN